MKKILYFVLVMILLACATPAAAKGGGIRIDGEITAINADDMTIIVGSTTVQVTTDTEITVASGLCDPLNFSDLYIGQHVRVTGVFHGDIIVAKRIIAYT